MRFENMVTSARLWMEYIQQNEQPDVVIGLFHSGKEGGIQTPEYDEDASMKVAREVPDSTWSSLVTTTHAMPKPSPM